MVFQLCGSLPSPMGESVIDCASVASMPNITFTIGDRAFDLTPDQVKFYSYICPISEKKCSFEENCKLPCSDIV